MSDDSLSLPVRLDSLQIRVTSSLGWRVIAGASENRRHPGPLSQRHADVLGCCMTKEVEGRCCRRRSPGGGLTVSALSVRCSRKRWRPFCCGLPGSMRSTAMRFSHQTGYNRLNASVRLADGGERRTRCLSVAFVGSPRGPETSDRSASAGIGVGCAEEAAGAVAGVD